MNDWTNVDDDLPASSRLVLAWLEGFEEHSDAMWHREGYALMVRWGGEPEHADAQGWSNERLERACKQLRADSLRVKYWVYLPAPPGSEAEGEE